MDLPQDNRKKKEAVFTKGDSATSLSLLFSYFWDISFLIESPTEWMEVPTSVITDIFFWSGWNSVIICVRSAGQGGNRFKLLKANKK